MIASLGKEELVTELVIFLVYQRFMVTLSGFTKLSLGARGGLRSLIVELPGDGFIVIFSLFS